jgi:hypothetical protein
MFEFKKPGTRRIDILPFIAGKGNPFANEGEPYFERTFYTHRSVGVNKDSYICLAKTFKKKCPVCEHISSLRAQLAKDSSDSQLEQLIKDLAPKERQLWAVRDHAAPDEPFVLWEVSNFLFGKKLDEKVRYADPDDNYEFFADPVDGFTLKLGIEEDSFAGTKFCKVVDIEFKRRSEPLDQDLLDSVPCLDDLLLEMPYEKLKAIYLEEEDDAEAEGTTKAGKKTSKGKSKQKPADDDEEDDDEDDDDLDAEEVDDLDDSEDDDLEDEDEDEDGDDLEDEDEDDDLDDDESDDDDLDDEDEDEDEDDLDDDEEEGFDDDTDDLDEDEDDLEDDEDEDFYEDDDDDFDIRHDDLPPAKTSKSKGAVKSKAPVRSKAPVKPPVKAKAPVTPPVKAKAPVKPPAKSKAPAKGTPKASQKRK